MKSAASKIIMANAILLIAVTAVLYFAGVFTTEVSRNISILRNSPDALERARAAVKLGEIKAMSAFDDLLWALKNDDNCDVRGMAAVGLGLLGDSRALTPLAEAIQKKYDMPEEKVSFIQALGLLGDPRAVELLRDVLENDSGTGPRVAAAEMLQRLGDNGGFDFLVETLETGKGGYRHYCAQVLEKFHDRRAVPPLIRAVGDPDVMTREFAAQTLGRLGNATAIGPLLNRLELETSERVKITISVSLHFLFQLMPEGCPVPSKPPGLNDSLTKQQIDGLKKWYEKHKHRLAWNKDKRRYYLKPEKEAGKKEAGKKE